MTRLVLAICVVLTLGGVARAEPEWAKGVPAETQAKANALFADANQLFSQQQHAPALEKYRAAIALWDHPMIRFNMAVTLIRLDRMLEAADDLDGALRYGNAPFTPELYQQALDYRAVLARTIGTVEASCTAPNTHILLDGKPWFTPPGSARQRVLAGEHVIVASRDGFMTKSIRVVVAGGAVQTEKIELMPIDSVVKLVYPYPRWVPWATTGVGAAIALGGLGFWVAGNNQMNDFQAAFAQTCASGCAANLSDQKALADERDSAHLKGQIGVSMMIAGGAVAIGGVVAAIVDSPRRVLPNVEVVPTSGGGMAVFGGHF